MLMRLELFVVDSSYFEASIKAFHRRVVVAVSFATHALPERMLFEPSGDTPGLRIAIHDRCGRLARRWPPEGYRLI